MSTSIRPGAATDPRSDGRDGVDHQPSAEDAMTEPPPPRPDDLPEWAVEQALQDLPASSEPSEVTALARQIAEDAQERFDERHDEYDDPDQGGEA
jgi:hypothetical protein